MINAQQLYGTMGAPASSPAYYYQGQPVYAGYAPGTAENMALGIPAAGMTGGAGMGAPAAAGAAGAAGAGMGGGASAIAGAITGMGNAAAQYIQAGAQQTAPMGVVQPALADFPVIQIAPPQPMLA